MRILMFTFDDEEQGGRWATRRDKEGMEEMEMKFATDHPLAYVRARAARPGHAMAALVVSGAAADLCGVFGRPNSSLEARDTF
jgi:hypothetical protein